jgi:hypothetical protein
MRSEAIGKAAPADEVIEAFVELSLECFAIADGIQGPINRLGFSPSSKNPLGLVDFVLIEKKVLPPNPDRCARLAWMGHCRRLAHGLLLVSVLRSTSSV